MPRSGSSTHFTYYAYCWQEDAQISKVLYPERKNQSLESRWGFRSMAQDLCGASKFSEHSPEMAKVHRQNFAEMFEGHLKKRSLGQAALTLSAPKGELHSSWETLLTECSPHFDLYRGQGHFFTFSETFGEQVLAQQAALQQLAVNIDPADGFDNALELFELMDAAGASDYWHLAILCRSTG